MKRFGWLTIVLITLVACRPVVNQNDALPLSEIPGGSQGPFSTDITGESAVIELSTGESTVCNVSYGPDEQYGSNATNMMLGSTSRNHNITLDNLMPNTIYHYRLNVTDKQGNLYQSDDYTFTTQ